MFKSELDATSGLMTIAAGSDVMGVIQLLRADTHSVVQEASHYLDNIMEIPAYIRKRIGKPFLADPRWAETGFHRGRVPEFVPKTIVRGIYASQMYVIKGGKRHDN